MNGSKCQFGLTELAYHGHHLSSDDLQVSDKKVKAVTSAKPPSNAQEVRRFLGFAQYCAKFIPGFAPICEPMRELTHGDVDFQWGNHQQKAFDRIKHLLTSAHVLAYFKQNAKTRLITDASPVGLGAILAQEQEDGVYKPMYYLSRSLTPIERRYAQFEKEALGIIWAVEHFHLYLLGLHFEIITDHKPLVHAYKPMGRPPARVERYALRLQPYSFDIWHIVGKSNVADYLSRLPLDCGEDISYRITEEYVLLTVIAAVPLAMTPCDIERESEEDEELAEVRTARRTDKWSNVSVKFKHVKDELSC